MSEGFALQSLSKGRESAVIDEKLIRACIYFAPPPTTDEERIRVVGNQEKALQKAKVLKVSAAMPLDDVETLLFSFRGISKIENLGGLTSLTKLQLDNNRIEKIENLDAVPQLECLDLSFNLISEIDGLDSLTKLTSLSLFGNQIVEVANLEGLLSLSSLSLGQNKIANLNSTVRYLHQLRKLKILTLAGNPACSTAHYRTKVLAFVATLRFFDGQGISKAEIATAREDQRENLLSLEDDDAIEAEETRRKAEETELADTYMRNNCPNESKLFAELLDVESDGVQMGSVLRCDGVYSIAKEGFERFQAEFNEKLAELAGKMKEIRDGRDADDAAFQQASQFCRSKYARDSRDQIAQFESLRKQYISTRMADGGARGDGDTLSTETAVLLTSALGNLQSSLMELASELLDTAQSLNSKTLAKWKEENVEVVLQTFFEALMKLETDWQVALRHVLDKAFEQRQNSSAASSSDGPLAFLNSKDEYQKVFGDWCELRRKKLGELEAFHLRKEDALLASRAKEISEGEMSRHRDRVTEIMDYVGKVKTLIKDHSSA